MIALRSTGHEMTNQSNSLQIFLNNDKKVLLLIKIRTLLETVFLLINISKAI